MEQGPVFRRRHFGNPEAFTLITTNYVVASFGLAIFAGAKHHVHWFFWVVMGILGLWNIFSIYRHREEFNRVSIIAYIISLAGLAVLFFFI